LPTLNNFIGEYLVLQGASQANFTWVVFAALGVIFSACYMLWLYQRAFYGKASESVSHHMPDLTGREWAAIIPLVILMVWMGTFTQTFLPSISAQNVVILEQSRDPQAPALKAGRAIHDAPPGGESSPVLATEASRAR
jgi:NADH-quinone oxidoreductase subunit M